MSYPRIHLTSFNNIVKPSLIEKIEKLGGCVLDPYHNQYNEACTHVVVQDNNVKPTERILAALAAGIWIVEVRWITLSAAKGVWLDESNFECRIGHELPKFHRLRAQNARTAQSVKSFNKQFNNSADLESAKQDSKAGGIFAGWTIYIELQNSTSNRSFRRVLSAGGATVIKTSDLKVAGQCERLNLVLTDDIAYPFVLQLVPSGTPIARHIFLRDVLLKTVSTSDIFRYLYSCPYDANLVKSEPCSQSLDSCTPSKLHVSGPPSSTKRPVNLRRRSRLPLACKANLFPSNNQASEVIVIDDDSDVKRNANSSTAFSKTALDDDIIVLTSIQSSSEPKQKRLKIDNCLKSASHFFSNADRCSVESKNGGCTVSTSFAERNLLRDSNAAVLRTVALTMKDVGCFVSDVPQCSRRSLSAEGPTNSQPIRVLSVSDDSDDCSVCFETVSTAVKSTIVGETQGAQDKFHELLCAAQKSNDKPCEISENASVNKHTNPLVKHDYVLSSHSDVAPLKEIQQTVTAKKIEMRSEAVNKSQIAPAYIEDVTLQKATNRSNLEIMLEVKSCTVDQSPSSYTNESSRSVAAVSTSVANTSIVNNRITWREVHPVIGRFMETRCNYSEIFSINLLRCFSDQQLSAVFTAHSRECTKSETGLYWSSVKNSGRLGIDISGLNSLSVMAAAPTGGIRGVAVDENDVDVVVNSLLWLKLMITSVHYPNAALMGDMLARYVIQCGVTCVQGQALSVAQHVLAMRPVLSSSAVYYTELIQSVASTLQHTTPSVQMGDTVWIIVDAIRERLQIASCEEDADSNSADNEAKEKKKSAPSLSYELWQYENHLLEVISFMLAIFEADLNAWKRAMRPVGELVSYKLIFGSSNNPAVLPRSAIRLIRLWLSLIPSSLQLRGFSTPSYNSITALRYLQSQLISLMLELVWLWHGQQDGGDRVNQSGRCSSMPFSDVSRDARFAPIFNEFVTAFKGLPVSCSLRHIQELPLARHRAFLTCVLSDFIYSSNAEVKANSALSDSVHGKLVEQLINEVVTEGKNCFSYAENRSAVAEKNSCCSSTNHNHCDKMQILLSRLHSCIQITGNVYIVRKANRILSKRKKEASNNACNNLSDTLVKSEYFDIYGNVFSEDVLHEHYKRFNLERRILDSCSTSMISAIKECEHLNLLKLLLSLLYIK